MAEALVGVHGVLGVVALVALGALAMAVLALTLAGRESEVTEPARRLLLGVVVVQVAIGAALALRGAEPAEWIHWVYGAAILPVLLVPSAFRPARGAGLVHVVSAVGGALLAWRLWGSG